jgi:hypothetical protein
MELPIEEYFEPINFAGFSQDYQQAMSNRKAGLEGIDLEIAFANEITDIKPLYEGIHLTLVGDKWCALIGENLQVGIAGFGDDPIAALSDLYAKLEGLDFVATVNTIGVKIALSIFKARDKTSLFSDFSNAYGNALFMRSNEGFTDREILIADWVGDNAGEDD